MVANWTNISHRFARSSGVSTKRASRADCRAGGGRVLDYRGKTNRRMCNLYLAMMGKIGLHLDQFGDSKETLAEL